MTRKLSKVTREAIDQLRSAADQLESGEKGLLSATYYGSEGDLSPAHVSIRMHGFNFEWTHYGKAKAKAKA